MRSGALLVLTLFVAGLSGCSSMGGGDDGPVQFRPVPRVGSNSRGLSPPPVTHMPSEAMPAGWPVDDPARKVISPYGVRRGSARFHRGTDIKAPRGVPVVATAPATVKFAGTMRGYGKLVVLDHGGGVETAYGHLDSIGVRVGDRVTNRAPIGRLGATGNASTQHVHYEVRIGDELVDPTPYISPAPKFVKR